jgi:hypothetical protein
LERRRLGKKTLVAKERSETHLSEDASEEIVKAQLPPEWVIRKLHPDYGVDVTIEVFERHGTRIPAMGEFLFVQLKSTSDVQKANYEIRRRGNVEKAPDDESGSITHDLDVIRYVLDVDTFDNARLMGPSTPLMLFLVDVVSSEVYYLCLTDYYDKILEPRGFDFAKQNSVTVYIPRANRLSAPVSIEVMRFYACRAKLYAMFNLAQFQYRESRHILADLSDHEQVSTLGENVAMLDRFARRLRAMPVWDRPTIWALLRDYDDPLPPLRGGGRVSPLKASDSQR